MGRLSDFFFGAPAVRNELAIADVQSANTDAPIVTAQGAWWYPATGTHGYGALLSVDYAACEQTKARSLSSLPVSVVRAGEGREKVDHPVARLLSGAPNEAMSAVDLLNWHRLRCDTFGTAYWRIEWKNGKVAAIWPVLCPVSVDFDRDRPLNRRMRYVLSGDDYNPAGAYFGDEVVAIKTNITKDGLKGISLAKLAAEQVGLSIDLERFYASMLRNGNHQLGHVEIDKAGLPDKALEDLKAAIAAKAGVMEAGKAPIFANGAKWVTDQQTMKDASVIEQQRWVLEQVCRACNVPPWKVYEATGVNYSASQQAAIDYATGTILPDVRAIEQAFAPVFAARNEGGLQLKFDLRGLMRGDDQARASYYRELTYLGAYTRADVREYEDLPPIDGLDRPLFPMNYGTVDADGSVTVWNKKATPADGNQTGVTD